jgi:hypothetical protein
MSYGRSKTCSQDLNLGGPVMNTSAVLGHAGWLAGVQAAYDTSKGKLVKNNFALGYTSGDFVLHSNVNDGSIFGASMYQKVVFMQIVHALDQSMKVRPR